MPMKSAYGLAAILLLAPSVVRSQDPTQAPPNKAPMSADHKRLQPEEAYSDGNVTLFGDPNKPGMYIIRNHFKPGSMSRPHFHDQDRFVTVIKGTWWTGEGDKFAPETAVPIKAGGMMFHPAGYHHYDGSKPGTEDVIVQIMGMGPVKTTQTEIK
jgi:oxalate decarboxylase/phosphoglucose isomerase-like protein (cupin superfamily)